MDIPMEFEVFIADCHKASHQASRPSNPFGSVRIGMKKRHGILLAFVSKAMRTCTVCLNPHDSPEGFHPLQKQHKLRYHDHNEMYDDAQGFMRKPADEGRVK